MTFNKHSYLEGQHAFLAASRHHWVNYDEEKLTQSYLNHKASERGTRLHQLACDLIRLGVRLPRTKDTLNLYVNDAIGFKMIPEQILYFSNNCFGTADAISFRKKMLRIHDLKTGVSPASVRQLEIYAALFCLEYKVNPEDIQTELRIYQQNEVQIYEPDPPVIQSTMDKIIVSDRAIEKLKLEG